MFANNLAQEGFSMLTREELLERIGIILRDAPRDWLEIVYGLLLGLGLNK